MAIAFSALNVLNGLMSVVCPICVMKRQGNKTLEPGGCHFGVFENWKRNTPCHRCHTSPQPATGTCKKAVLWR